MIQTLHGIKRRKGGAPGFPWDLYLVGRLPAPKTENPSRLLTEPLEILILISSEPAMVPTSGIRGTSHRRHPWLTDKTIGTGLEQALSPVGRCRTFEAAGDGYGRGEGFAAVVLARFESDMGNIEGVVLGSATNQGGRASGLTAPHGPSQSRLILQAVKVSSANPADISFVVVHGTGKRMRGIQDLRERTQ